MAGRDTTLSYKVIGHLGKLLARNQAANKAEMRELERDLSALKQPDADALVEAGTLELLLRYLTVEQHFDVVTKCLIALSAFESARVGLCEMAEAGILWLSEYMLQQARAIKGEKAIERVCTLVKILIMYSVDIADSELAWLIGLTDLLVTALSRAHAKPGMQDSYNYMSVILPAFWASFNTPLPAVITAHIIAAGGMSLLLTVAKDVQRSDLKGLPKIIAEKALNLLCACNAEQPSMSLEQIEPRELATFCIDTTVRSDWVQSQELAVVLLGRLVFLQRALPLKYMETPAVIAMLQHAMKSKSPALRMTAFCLSCVCSEAVFEAVCIEANQVLMDLAEGSFQSVKRLASVNAGGMTVLRWGMPLNKFAQDLLRPSKLLARMAEALPLHLPPQLAELLPDDLKQYVTSIKAAHGVKDSPMRERAYDEEEDEDEEEEEEDEGLAKGRGAQQPLASLPPAAAPPRTAPPAAGERRPLAAATNTKPVVGVKPESGGVGAAGGGAPLPTNGHSNILNPSAGAKPSAPADKPRASAPAGAVQQPGTAAPPQPNGATAGGAGKRVRANEPGEGGDSQGSRSQGAAGPDGKRGRVLAGAAAGTASGAAGGRAASAGGRATSGEAGGRAGPFTSADFSSLNSFVYELVVASMALEPRAQEVANTLMKGAGKLPHLLRLKQQAPPEVVEEVDESMRQWAARVRQMGGSLPNAKGPALDMLVTFSSMMLDEITCCCADLEQPPGGGAGGGLRA